MTDKHKRARKDSESIRRGPIAWMAANRVAANLLMMLFLIGGLLLARSVQQEVFPNVQMDIVTVSMAYPGASPSEVEQGIVLAVEEAIRGIEGVKEVRATASEGIAMVSAELFIDAEPSQVLDDIKSAVDRITSFPEDAEEPIISLANTQVEVLSLIVHGDVDRQRLDTTAEEIRSALLRQPSITRVDIQGLPPPEISIEVSQENSRRYGLTLQQIANLVAGASLDLPSGELETESGELLLRVTERREVGEQFEDIAIIAQDDGSIVRLGDIATVVDGFRDEDREGYFNGEPAARIRVFRVGDQTPRDVADAVTQVVEQQRARLPDSVGLAVINDMSKVYSDRIGLLMKNGQLGVILVLLILGAFLHPRLAFWVTLGIPISFLGAFLFLPAMDVSINMISLFAFLLVLGIVVDDAIVVGESTFYQRRRGLRPYAASVEGTREVVQPVIFAVLTTMLAFMPLLFVPGLMGKFFSNIPLIVLPILTVSLIESMFILPAHLSHVPHKVEEKHNRWSGWFTRRQQAFSNWVEDQVEHRFTPMAAGLMRWRYLTLASAFAVLLGTAGLVLGGRLAFHFMPDIEGDLVTATVELPFGAPISDTRAAVEQLSTAAREAGNELTDPEGGIITGIYAEVGVSGQGSEFMGGGARNGSHLAYVQVILRPAAEREIGAATFTRRWRELAGTIYGAERLSFSYSTGPAAGAAVALELAHEDRDVLRAAAEDLAAQMDRYAGVQDIDDGFQEGKPQLDITLKPGARILGITERELATQLRAAYFGAEARRQQRGREELRIYVRRPENERDSAYYVDRFIVLTPEGGEIPLEQAAFVERGRSFTNIEREQGRRVVDVTADVDERVTSGGEVTGALEREVMPQLLQRYAGLDYELSGEQQERNESMDALIRGMSLAILAMYALMAVAFRSYIQPLIIVLSVPFGFVGAVWGHILLGFSLNIISMFGLVALTGVVVNDSLVLISAINRIRAQGESTYDAVIAGAKRRFRPVLLTSLTTFFGLAPMIFETSIQARFLIPMAISLGFGVLFVTVIALVLVPCAYLVVDDIKALFSRRSAVASR